MSQSITFPERSLAVLGPGLLGGSLLRDARALGCGRVTAYARRQVAVDEILSLGLADAASTNLAETVADASLIVLASPVGSYRSLAEALVKLPLAKDVLVTDVGSVKGVVMQGAGQVFADAGVAFIGSHPMAGKEQSGLAASQTGLYSGAVSILTPPAHLAADGPEMQRLAAFWQCLGSRTALLPHGQHDHTVARISHLPHLAAVSTILAALRQNPDLAQFAAGGLRDTTRVASGNPTMWQEIFATNKAEILAAGRDLIASVQEILTTLESGDAEVLVAKLTEAKRLRDARYHDS